MDIALITLCIINLILSILILIKKGNKKLSFENRVKYTNEILNSVKNIIGDYCIFKFNEYINLLNLDENVTKENYKNYIYETEQEIKQRINYDGIDFDSMIINNDYFDSYVVYTTIIFMKNLLEKERSKGE